VDILAVEHDVIPLDWADVFQQGEIDSIRDRVALTETEDPGRFPTLPVDDARQDQVQAAAGPESPRSSFPSLRGFRGWSREGLPKNSQNIGRGGGSTGPASSGVAPKAASICRVNSSPKGLKIVVH
jgi:hypothetical protein